MLLLLSFPVLEAIGIFWVAHVIGGWVWLWLMLAAVAGILLIRLERATWGPRLLFSVQAGGNPLAALFASGRILLAGGLLIFPGFISDLLALVLLLTPGTWSGRRANPLQSANDDGPSPQPSPAWREGANATPKTIDGEFRREPDDLLR
ncbi:FxsA family protein [Thiobacillus sedimenti]|uniref:FxsA family protein n=1 Tax=Thiobacillus sedimenti TaxID=3110231 RepID=A0ABZ1CIZ1_9PROT|nr:FxsA family protein [Thiobacillus sp. SCUT-2]WRS39035.1 FxsA family protein [Thiobacillus sp. SCUT-2]